MLRTPQRLQTSGSYLGELLTEHHDSLGGVVVAGWQQDPDEGSLRCKVDRCSGHSLVAFQDSLHSRNTSPTHHICSTRLSLQIRHLAVESKSKKHDKTAVSDAL